MTILGKKSAELYECSLGVSHQTAELVAEVDAIAQVTVGFDRILGLSNDSFNFVLRQSGGWRNAHLLFAPGRFIHGRHGNDAVCVNFKGDVDLGNATRRRRNSD